MTKEELIDLQQKIKEKEQALNAARKELAESNPPTVDQIISDTDSFMDEFYQRYSDWRVYVENLKDYIESLEEEFKHLQSEMEELSNYLTMKEKILKNLKKS